MGRLVKSSIFSFPPYLVLLPLKKSSITLLVSPNVFLTTMSTSAPLIDYIEYNVLLSFRPTQCFGNMRFTLRRIMQRDPAVCQLWIQQKGSGAP